MIEWLTGGLAASWQLAATLAWLSLFSIGGAHTVFPDVYRFIVEDKRFFTAATFGTLVALSQAAPGPNMLVFAMFGYQLGGVGGAALNAFAFCAVPIVVSYGVARVARAAAEAKWSRIIQSGLAPLTVGVVLASGIVLAEGAARGAADDLHSGLAFVLVIITVIVASVTKWNPLWLISVGAAVAMLV